MKLLLYCTKAKKQKDLLWSNNLKHFFLDGAYNRLIDNLPDYLLNGKIVAECDFEVEELTNCGTSFMIMKYDDLKESYRYTNKIARESCLNYTDLRRYLGTNNGYAIHIKNLHIFDKPYNLGEALIYNWESQYIVEKAPQNMCRVYNQGGLGLILISIKPEHLCKILNGEKTIEVRKKVLKEMVKND